MHAFAFAGFIKAEGDRRAAVANVVAAANLLCPVDVAQRDIVGRREMLSGEGIQRPDINVTYRVTFTGPDGGEMAGGDNRQEAVTAQLAGGSILIGIIVGDGL
jgi:hypothetical protein